MEIVLLLQGTPLDDFARHNLSARGDRVVVRCAETTKLTDPDGERCKRSMATALRRYSYRFTMRQLGVLADLYVKAIDQLEPDALIRVRDRMCDPASEESLSDATAARAVCERISLDY
jgi:hypothetical protein